MNKLKTIDEICGNPPGSFLDSIEKEEQNQKKMDKALNNRIKLSKISPPPRRECQSIRMFIFELANWEELNKTTYTEYLEMVREK
jgi:hypothetical protein